VYEFERRILRDKEDVLDAANGRKLSFPTTNSRWTDKYLPGLDYMAQYQDDAVLDEKLGQYLSPLVEFAKEVLQAKHKEWRTYPIYLKATGGLRTLPQAQRVRLINAVRSFFKKTANNPFSFDDERARVISGEEEAIYGWTAVNFIKGTLIEQSKGTGTVLNPGKGTRMNRFIDPATPDQIPIESNTRRLTSLATLLY
jgi:Golgi nucleoside diphosphatase